MSGGTGVPLGFIVGERSTGPFHTISQVKVLAALGGAHAMYNLHSPSTRTWERKVQLQAKTENLVGYRLAPRPQRGYFHTLRSIDGLPHLISTYLATEGTEEVLHNRNSKGYIPAQVQVRRQGLVQEQFLGVSESK
eukprot:3424941-Amphidinium_carterae.3